MISKSDFDPFFNSFFYSISTSTIHFWKQLFIAFTQIYHNGCLRHIFFKCKFKRGFFVDELSGMFSHRSYFPYNILLSCSGIIKTCNFIDKS